MPEGDGAALQWRLEAAERRLEALDVKKADSKDLDGLARVVRDGNSLVNERIEKSDRLTAERFDGLEKRDEANRIQSKTDRKRAFWYVFGAVVTLAAAFIGSGHIG